MTPSSTRGTFAMVFMVVYAVAYAIAVENNYALFTYHPATGEFGPLVQAAREGPAMYWYGWMTSAAIAASIAAGIASSLPHGVQRFWSGWSWAFPIAAMVLFGYLLRGFFMR